MTKTKKDAYISNKSQLQNRFFTIIQKVKSFLSATLFISRQPKPMVYNTAASLDNITYTSYEGFDDFNYLDVKLKVLKKDDHKDFRLVQSLTMGEACFNQFIRLMSQLVIAAENLGREENMSFVLFPTLSIDMDEEHNLAHRIVDFVYLPNKKIRRTMLWYNVDERRN